MTYLEYQQKSIENSEAMKATRIQQSECHRDIEDEHIKELREAKEEFRKQQMLINERYKQKVFENAERWKAERKRLYLEHAKVIEQWREENKNNLTQAATSDTMQEGGEG